MFNSPIKGNLLGQWKKAGPFNLYSLLDLKKIIFDESLDSDLPQGDAAYKG